MWFLPSNGPFSPSERCWTGQLPGQRMNIGIVGADRIGSSRGQRDVATVAPAKRGLPTASASVVRIVLSHRFSTDGRLSDDPRLRPSTGFQVEECFRVSGQHLASMRIVEIDLIDDIQRFVDRTEWRISGKDNLIGTKEL